MGAGYASEGVVSRTTVRRGASEAPAPFYPAVYFDLRPLVSHLKSFRFVPADGIPFQGASSALWAVLMTL